MRVRYITPISTPATNLAPIPIIYKRDINLELTGKACTPPILCQFIKAIKLKAYFLDFWPRYNKNRTVHKSYINVCAFMLICVRSCLHIVTVILYTQWIPFSLSTHGNTAKTPYHLPHIKLLLKDTQNRYDYAFEGDVLWHKTVIIARFSHYHKYFYNCRLLM